MKRVVSTIVAVSLLLGLGALAVLASPGGADSMLTASRPAAVAPAALVALAAPDAPAATMFNFVAMPLNSSASITPFRASGLAGYVGSSVAQVMQWNAAAQGFDSFVPGVSPPVPPFDFDLAVGGSYFLELGSGPTVLSLVGGVPLEGSVLHTLVKGTSTTDCKFNSVSIPLDREDITTAQGLADDVSGVVQVMTWNAAAQGFDSYLPGISPPVPPFNFEVKIGYPYFLCVNSDGPTTWQ